MKKIIIVSVLISLLMSGSLFAQPQKGMYGKQCRHDGFRTGQGGGLKQLMRMSDELKLTDQQQTELQEMTLNFEIERIDLEADTKKASVKLKALMRDDAVSERELFSQIDAVSVLKADAKKMHYRHRQQVRSVLTDEQQEQMKELKKERRREYPKGKHSTDGERKHPKRQGRHR